MKRGRSGGAAFLVVVAASLLAAGWVVATVRDQHARAEIETLSSRAVLAAAERGVLARVDELRTRENERPFYVYSHYYIPPDLLTISDAIATSPLASARPAAPMIGWFQLEADGTVRTPLAPEPGATPSPLEARLARVARSSAVEALRASIVDRPAGALVARVAPSAEASASRAPRAPRASTRVLVEVPDAGAGPIPLAVALNLQANSLADDIQRAQAGDRESYARASASNQAPLVAQIVQQSSNTSPSGSQSGGAAIPQASSAPQGVTASPVETTRSTRPRATRPLARTPREAPSLPTVPAEVAVHYTPMRWLDAGDADAAWVLARIVSSEPSGAPSEAAAVVQGAVVDRAAFVALLRETAANASVEGRDVEIVTRVRGCALTRANRSLPPGISLCLREASRASFRAEQRRAMQQVVVLVAALVGAVLVALFALARVARREAELADRRRDFVSAVSHELRTPLTTLRMHAEMLHEGLVETSRAKRVYAELVNESMRMTRLVENVLEASRLEAGKREVSVTEGDVRASVARAVEAHVAIVAACGMRLVWAEGAPVPMAFDESALERIVSNLIDNAAKYARDANDENIEVRVASTTKGLELRVRDHGPGIPETERGRVFERFHRVVRASDAHRPGTGLGLALVRELARAHGGDAHIEPTPGGGTTVVVVLADLAPR